MKQLKNTTFSDRLALQAEARRAQLEKFKPKPMVTGGPVVDRVALREAELAEVRAARERERDAAREQRALLEEQARLEAVALEEAARSARRESIKERKAREKSEARARREAQFAAMGRTS